MIVRTIKHARQVFRRFLSFPYFVGDTETEPKQPAKTKQEKKNTLVWNRMSVYVWSMCHRGESYSFLTNKFDRDAPTFLDYINTPEFQKLRKKKRAVFHNLGYDTMAFASEDINFTFKKQHCTMIGGWMANPGREKTLKARAPLYGRHIHKTSQVNFDDLNDVSEYAEADVIAADEMFQHQMYGHVIRPKYLFHLNAKGKLVKSRNPMPAGKLYVQGEELGDFEKLWLKLQEFPFLRSTFRSQKLGFVFSVKRLRKIRKKITAAKEKLLKKIYRKAGEVFNLGSNPQKSRVFAKVGIKNPFKTKKGAPCWNAGAIIKIQMAGGHPFLSMIQEYQSLDKLSKYTDKNKGLEFFVQKGRLHPNTNTVGAVTGRTSSSGPNCQQIPSRKDTFGLKTCFRAPKGYSLLVLDHAGLELRVMAILAREQRMADALNDPTRDIHRETSETFNVDRDPTAKQINFLLQYAGMAYALAEKLTIEGVPTTPEIAQNYVDIYRRERPNVIRYRERLLEQHQSEGSIELLFGRRRALVETIRWGSPRDRHKAETTLSNNVVQGSGQDLLKAAIIRCDWKNPNPDRAVLNRFELKPSFRNYLKDKARQLEKLRREFKLADLRYTLQVHDEGIWTVRDEAAEEVGNKVAELMCWKHYFPAIVPYNTRLRVEGGIDKDWKAAKSKQASIHIDKMADYLG